MARYKYRGIVMDGAGNVQDSADIGIYNDGTTDPSTVYSSESSPTELDTAPQVQSDSNGYFEFWIDDGDYDVNSRFKTIIEKGSYSYTETGIVIVTGLAQLAQLLSAVLLGTSDLLTLRAKINETVQLLSTASKPTANSANRGCLWLEKGTNGVSDKLQIVVKKSDDSYAWVDIIQAP